MSRDETPDTTGLREAVEALADDYADRAARVPGDIHAPYRHAAADLREILAAHPTPDASPDPAVVTPDADVEALLREHGLSDRPDEYDSDIHSWRCQYREQYGPCSCFQDLAADIANLVAAAREADRAEVERAITEHAAHMGTYTIPAMSPGFIDGYHQALRLLARDAEAIAHRATRGAS